MIKNAIKNHNHETDFYSTADDINNTENEFVPLVPHWKWICTTADNQMSPKWLNNVLSKCGFAVSYDKVGKIWVSLRLGFSL